jgi:NAD(P)-dependent dehydrogenase (short-subunit alcohol dehydrogenase family)
MARRDGLKVAMVTGAGSGLGRAVCLALGARNWTVYATDLRLEAAQETLALLRAKGGEGRAAALDVRDAAALEALAATIWEEQGRCDLVVNNAGVAVAGEVGKVSLEDWRWCLDIDLYGPIHGCHVFAPRLRAQGFGHIVNVASIAGIAHAVRMGPYNVAKAGVISLSETLRAELLGSGVGVTAVCPAFFPTNIAQNMRSHRDGERAAAQRFLDRATITADDVAAAILKAVERNEPYVIMPREAQLIFWLRRLFPAYTTELFRWVADRRANTASA